MSKGVIIEYRCDCRQLLFKGTIVLSRIELKCKRCSKVVVIDPDNSDDGAQHYGIMVDSNLNIINASKNASNILGYSNEEFLNMKGYELSPYYTKDEAVVNFNTSIKIKEKPIAFDSAHKTKDGKIINLRVRTHTTGIFNKGYVLYLFETIDLVDNINTKDCANFEVFDTIFSFNNDGNVDYVSNKICTDLNWNKFNILGVNFKTLLDLDSVPDFDRKLKAFNSTRFPFEIDGLKIKNADNFPLKKAFFLPRYKDDGHLRGYAVIFR